MSRFARLKALLSRSRLSAEVEEELASHIEMRTADNISAGMSPEEARRRCRVFDSGIQLQRRKKLLLSTQLWPWKAHGPILNMACGRR